MKLSKAPSGCEPDGSQPGGLHPFYGILGAYIPLSLLFLTAPLLGVIYRFLGSVSFDARLWCLAGFLSALAASVYAEIMKKITVNHSAADIRGGIIVMGTAYIFISVFRLNVSLAGRFLPGINSVTAALAALIMWFAVLSLKKVFTALEQFESFMAEYQGEQLRNVMREFSPEMGEADQRVKKLMVNYGITFMLLCLILTSTGFYRYSILFTVFVFITFCAGFLLLSFLGSVRRELACACEGFTVTIRDRAVLFPSAALGIGIAALFAAAGSSNTSLIPPEIILNFFRLLARFLSSLFRHREFAESPLPIWETMPMQGGGFEDFLPEIERTGPWPGWQYIKYGVIALAALLFLLFMIYPLLKRSWSSVKAETIRNALFRWFLELKTGLAAFFAAIREWRALGLNGVKSKTNKPDQKKLRRIASQLLGGAKQKELTRSVNLFARLILWGGETLKVSWKPSLPPGEYCDLLASQISTKETEDSKNIKEAIIRCGELFEKALYSPRHLSTREEQRFKLTIQSITGT